MSVNIELSGDIRSTLEGYNRLAWLAWRLEGLELETVYVDFRGVGWLDANMCAALGAILYRSATKVNTITLRGISPALHVILSKNGFLSHYGMSRLPDTYGTTMDFTRFEAKDARFFGEYVQEKFVGKGIPEMTVALRRELQRNIFEIFENAVMHAQSKLGIFACGQFFPRKDRLDFSVADLGVGMRANLKARLGIDLPADAAIAWAMADRNTTKTGPVPGGLGLKLLQSFIGLNLGKIQIASDQGYWELSGGRTQWCQMTYAYPGTVVNVEINTADKQSYKLAGELSIDDIF